jgi:long-chain acyl-CoA synthetase
LIDEGRVVKKGGKINLPEATSSDVYLFSYTSGTTGNPKAVKITHRMMIAGMTNGDTAFRANPNFGDVNNDDRYLSFLPMAHVLE